MALTKAAVFFQDRNNPQESTVTLGDGGKRGFRIFGRKKSKRNLSPKRSDGDFPAISPLSSDSPKPSAVRQELSVDKDAELRTERSRKDGVAFVTLAGPAKMAFDQQQKARGDLGPKIIQPISFSNLKPEKAPSPEHLTSNIQVVVVPTQSVPKCDVDKPSIARKASDKSNTDSGKDLGSNDQQENLDCNRENYLTSKRQIPNVVVLSESSSSGPLPSLSMHLKSSQADASEHRPQAINSVQQRLTSIKGLPKDQFQTATDNKIVFDDRPRALSLPAPVMVPPKPYITSLNKIQISCLTSHKHSVQCTNLHHRIMCMVCNLDAPSERWSCSFCALRFCSKCKAEITAGKALGDIPKRVKSEDWQSQSMPTSPIGSISRNMHWELACAMEARGSLRVPARGWRIPPQSRRSPPRQIPGKSPRNSYIPDENPTSLSSSDNDKPSSRNPSATKKYNPDHSVLNAVEAPDADRITRKDETAMTKTHRPRPKSAIECCSAVVMNTGSQAEQRRALLESGF